MIKYFNYLPKILFPLILFFIVSIFLFIASLSQPFIFKIIYDELIQTTDKTMLSLVVVVVTISYILFSFSNLLTETLSTQIRGKLIALIRTDISSEILKYRYSFFQRNDVGGIVQRLIPEIDTLSDTITAVVKSFAYLFQLILILLMTLYFHVAFFMICLVSLFVYVSWHSFVKRPIVYFTSQVQKAQGELYNFFTEHFQNIKVIKLFRVYKRPVEHLESRLRFIKNRSILNEFFKSLLSISTKILDLTILGIVIFSFYKITSGKMTVGFYLLFTILLERLVIPIGFLVELGKHLQSGKVAAQRIEEIRTGEVELSGKIKCGFENKGIEFKNVEYSYDHNRKILDRISFAIPAGSSVAFVGGSGSGKSTIIQLLVRLYEPMAGCIYLDGNPIQNYQLDSLRDQINVLSQDFFLFNNSIKENIDPRGLHSKKEILAILNLADLSNFSEQLGYGIGEGGWNLSGGERQRLSIARLLTRSPRIIVLDEATSNLDPKTEKIIMNNILQFRMGNPGLIVIMITHRVQHLSQMDKVFFVDNGMIVDQGSHDELKSRNERYVNILNTLVKN